MASSVNIFWGSLPCRFRLFFFKLENSCVGGQMKEVQLGSVSNSSFAQKEEEDVACGYGSVGVLGVCLGVDIVGQGGQ